MKRRATGGLDPFHNRADDAGLLLLAPESRGRSWDVILGGYGLGGYAPYVEFIDRALARGPACRSPLFAPGSSVMTCPHRLGARPSRPLGALRSPSSLGAERQHPLPQKLGRRGVVLVRK